jgi:hypothetical protein
MKTRTDNPTAPVVSGPRRPPVRVKLQRLNSELSKAHPPDGEAKTWWHRLKGALGTTSSDFVNASLLQLQAAARLPCSGISEMAVNAALAMIEAAAPRDEIEGALAVQIACTHAAAMAVLGRIPCGHGSERRLATFASAAAQLLRANAAQVEAFRRLRHGGQQYVRVEHFHISDGRQAIMGNVKPSDARKLVKTEREMPTQTNAAGGRVHQNVNRGILFLELVEAAAGNVVHDAPGVISVEPIEQLLKQGCDLNLDVLPAVRDLIAAPGQPPLCNSTVPWLVKKIIRQRDARMARGRATPAPAAARAAPTQQSAAEKIRCDKRPRISDGEDDQPMRGIAHHN